MSIIFSKSCTVRSGYFTPEYVGHFIAPPDQAHLLTRSIPHYQFPSLFPAPCKILKSDSKLKRETSQSTCYFTRVRERMNTGGVCIARLLSVNVSNKQRRERGRWNRQLTEAFCMLYIHTYNM